MAAIEVRHLYKSFTQKGMTVEALSDINLTVEQGDIYGIIGMSGAGKSTLVRCFNYLERPTDGQVLIEGRQLGSLTEKELRVQRSEIAMIFQNFNLLMQKNVLDNICFPMRLSGKKKSEARQRARELLAMVGLAERNSVSPSRGRWHVSRKFCSVTRQPARSTRRRRPPYWSCCGKSTAVWE